MSHNPALYQEQPSRSWRGLVFFLFTLVTVACLFISTLTWMTDANRLPLSRLVIDGPTSYVSDNDIRRAILNLEQLGSFMTQDVNDVQSAIEALPWVAQASVRKQWPDTLKVFVSEHQPVATWNQQHLVNTTGEVFFASALQVAELGLVDLAGPEGSHHLLFDALREMQPRLQNAGFELVRLSLSERHSWQIWLKTGVRIELGRKDRMTRLRRFIRLYPEILKQGKVVDYIDLRYDTGAAVGWQTPEKMTP